MGAMMSGVVTAHHILKYGKMSSLLTGHYDLFDDCKKQGYFPSSKFKYSPTAKVA